MQTPQKGLEWGTVFVLVENYGLVQVILGLAYLCLIYCLSYSLFKIYKNNTAERVKEFEGIDRFCDIYLLKLKWYLT